MGNLLYTIENKYQGVRIEVREERGGETKGKYLFGRLCFLRNCVKPHENTAKTKGKKKIRGQRGAKFWRGNDQRAGPKIGWGNPGTNGMQVFP